MLYEVITSPPVDTEHIDSLKIYLRQISQNKLLSQDEQLELTKIIGEFSMDFRKRVYQLGFVLPEHIKLLADCTVITSYSIHYTKLYENSSTCSGTYSMNKNH